MMKGSAASSERPIVAAWASLCPAGTAAIIGSAFTRKNCRPLRGIGGRNRPISISPAPEPFELVAADHLLEDQFDVRHLLAAGRDQFGHIAVGRCGGEADIDRAGLALGDAPRQHGRTLRELQDQPRLGQEALAGRRQPDQAIAALKQFYAQYPFENLDLPAERRLRHVQPGSGAAEMQLLCHGHEATYLAQFEHATPFFLDRTDGLRLASLAHSAI